MIKLSEKHKDKLIGGLIGIFILALGLLVKNYLSKPSEDKTQQINSIKNISKSQTIDNLNKDSAKQTINEVSQTNSNNGDVVNEFVSGDKKTYKNTYNKPKNETKIMNNGFLNQGGSGNTYNQTINTDVPQRHFTQLDFMAIKNNLKSESKYIITAVYDFDKESTVFANEIISYFEKNGFTSIEPRIANKIGFQFPEEKKGKMELFFTENPNSFIVHIYPLK